MSMKKKKPRPHQLPCPKPPPQIRPARYRHLREKLLQSFSDSPETVQIAQDISDIIKRHQGKISQWLRTEPVLDKQTIAIAILYLHPEWSDSEIAAEAGVHRGSLYRWKPFTDARKIMKNAAKASAKRRRGFVKKGDDGTYDVDAMDNPADGES